MVTEPTRIEQISKIIEDLLQIEDLDLLLEYVLTEIRRMINADAGSIYLAEGMSLKFSHAQNNTLQSKLPFGKKLIYTTFSIPINNKSIAGYTANTGILTNIKNAYSIDTTQPYSFDQQFDTISNYHTQSILTVPIKSPVGKVLGVIQLINALQPDKTIRSFTTAEETIVQLFAEKVFPAIKHAQMMRAMIRRTNKMLEYHDPSETINHAERVAAYSVEIYENWARKRGIPEREIRLKRALLRMAAMLHDIGKIAIDINLLRKNKDLSQEEQITKEQHTIYGARLFSNTYSDFEEMARTIALSHHEHWDGSGYPGYVNIDTGLPLAGYEKSERTAIGKSDTSIPIYGRIVAVANSYDVFTHKSHTTNEPLTTMKEQAIARILADSGKQFDPDVVTAFVSCLEIINALDERYS